MHAPQNKMKHRRQPQPRSFLSLSLWQEEKTGLRWRSNPRPQGPKTQRLTADTHTQRETKEPAARSNAVAADGDTETPSGHTAGGRVCVVLGGGNLLQVLQIRRVLQRLGDGLAAHLAQIVGTQAASKHKRAIKAHTDISAQTQRGVNARPPNKMEQASAASALFFLSLSL